MTIQRTNCEVDSYQEFHNKDAILDPNPPKKSPPVDEYIHKIAMTISDEFAMSSPRAERLVERVLWLTANQKKDSA